jgi:hypothetical protein
MRTAPLAVGTNEPTALLAPVTHESHEVNSNALAGMTIVRRFGMADMCDREHVINLVGGLGFSDGADWLRANRHLYFIALRQLVG